MWECGCSKGFVSSTKDGKSCDYEDPDFALSFPPEQFTKVYIYTESDKEEPVTVIQSTLVSESKSLGESDCHESIDTVATKGHCREGWDITHVSPFLTVELSSGNNYGENETHYTSTLTGSIKWRLLGEDGGSQLFDRDETKNSLKRNLMTSKGDDKPTNKPYGLEKYSANFNSYVPSTRTPHRPDSNVNKQSEEILPKNHFFLLVASTMKHRANHLV